MTTPSINEFLSSAKDQYGFRPTHSTTSALLQLITDFETDLNQRKPPHRTLCVTIDLTAAFDTVSHDILISKIAGSSLPPAITRWLSCYMRGRQVATSFRGIKSCTRIVRTGIPQGSKLSPSLFNYYTADMPRPTPPVNRVCYADEITVWASGPKIPLLELPERCRHLPEGKLAFDICCKVNRHTLLPGHTPVPDASIYYS